MYVPGAKGKFITEMCDLLITNSNDVKLPVNVKSGGHVSWTDQLKYVIDGDTNGIFPEELHYKEYIKRITDKANKQDINVDTHYTKLETIIYLLANNHNVIFINTDEDDILELVDNFYYKNFIAPFYTGIDPLKKTKQIEGLLIDNYKTIKSLNDNEFNLVKEYFAKPFYQWSKECYDICYTMARHSCNPPKLNPKELTHNNFLYLEYKNLGQESTIQSIANLMSNGVISKVARYRFNSYTDSQAFGTYNEFIEKFILDFADKNVV